MYFYKNNNDSNLENGKNQNKYIDNDSPKCKNNNTNSIDYNYSSRKLNEIITIKKVVNFYRNMNSYNSLKTKKLKTLLVKIVIVLKIIRTVIRTWLNITYEKQCEYEKK